MNKILLQNLRLFLKKRNNLTTLILLLLFSFLNITKTQAQNFAWAKAIGGTGTDTSRSIAVDASGNVYTTGYFPGTVDFDPNAGVSNITSAGAEDIFVSKLDTNGNLVWAKAIGGTGGDRGYGITVDAAGNLYTTGYFQGTVDFDPNAGVSNLTSVGVTDIFVSKLDTNGNLVWAKAMGDTSGDAGFGINVDAAGNVYTTGNFQGTVDFDPNAGVSNLTSAGVTDIFVSKLDANGNLVWAKAMGGTSGDIGNGISTDAAGNVYTTGSFAGTVDLDPNAGVSNFTSAGGNDIFIAKLDAIGNLVWAKAMGGTTNDVGYGISADATGNVYTVGSFIVTVDFDPNVGVFNLTSAGSADIFVLRLDTAGNLVWAKAMGGTSVDIGYGINTDASGNVYTTGNFSATADFDPNAGVSNLTAVSGFDVFVSKLDASGNLLWAKGMGGNSTDVGYGISADTASNNVYATGIFTGIVDFDPNAGVSNLTSLGAQDIFIHKMSPTQGATLNFDGVNDSVSIPNQPVSNLNNFTFEAWVYASATTYQMIYAEGNTSDNNPMFSLTKMPNTSGFEIVLRNSSAMGLVAGSTTGYAPLNTWTHVVFVRTSATTASLYVNGVNTDNFTFADPGSIAVNVANLGIRQRVGLDGWFNGNMDEVRIWNRALTQAEIQNNMNCELSASQTGLVSYYKFNQGIDNANNSTITILTDASGNGNTGTLNNFALTGTASNWVASGGVTTGNTCSPFLSTNGFEFSSKLAVYPNPSSDIFSINSDTRGTIAVYDLMGKIIKSETINLGVTKLDLSNYPSGIYLMKVTNDSNQTKTMKLIKQ